MIKIHKMIEKQKISIIGASGLVGYELSMLIKNAIRFARNEKEDDLGKIYSTHQFDPKQFDLVFLCTPSEVSKQLAPKCTQENCTVIDLSSAFRKDPKVPLIIPEINPLEIYSRTNLIASPNCTTTILLMALFPLHKIWNLRSCRVTTYQAASGGGKELLTHLIQDTKAVLSNSPSSGLGFCCYPHEAKKNEHG